MTRDDEHSSANSIVLDATGPPLRHPLATLLLPHRRSGRPAAPARAADSTRAPHIEVVQVEGAIDPVVSDLIIDSLTTRPARASDQRHRPPDQLRWRPRHRPGGPDPGGRRSTVPVAPGWARQVGRPGGRPPRSSGRRARRSVDPVPPVGPERPARLDATSSGPAGTAARRELAGKEAVESGSSTSRPPPWATSSSASTAAPSDHRRPGDAVDGQDRQDRRRPSADRQPARPVPQAGHPRAGVQHSLTSPSVAYLLLVVGLALMVFEFFTAGSRPGRPGRRRLPGRVLLRLLPPARQLPSASGSSSCPPSGSPSTSRPATRVSGPAWASSACSSSVPSWLYDGSSRSRHGPVAPGS